MLKIPKRAAAPDLWNDREVIHGWRRASGPLQSPCIPGITADGLTMEVRPKQVGHENQNGRGLKEHPDGHDQIQRVPTAARFVGINPAGHAEKSRNMHEIEGQMESDDEEPKVQFAERFVVHFSGHFREPIIESAKSGKKNGAYDHVMKMGHDEIGISEVPSERRCA